MVNHDLILRQIKNNKLNGLNEDFVVAQLCVLNNKPYEEINTMVKDLIDASELEVNDAGELVVAVIENNKSLDYDQFMPQEKNRYERRNKSLRIEGKIQGTKGPFAFFIPFDSTHEDVYISEHNLNGALNNDSVLVEVKKTKRGFEGYVLQVLERGQDKIVGKITITKGGAFVAPDDVKFGKDIFVGKATLGANNGDKVVVKIVKFFANRNPEGEVVEVLGPPNKIETEVMAVIRSYNLYETFPKKVLEASEKVSDTVLPEHKKNRKDLTNDLLFTIDGEDARDLDDAISLTQNSDGTLRLGVHIADVGEYVKHNSVIDNEAFKRGTSVYFPSLVLPMLPQNLSNGICSLNEMVERLALSVYIDYDHSAKVKNYEIFESVIKSKKRFTYTEIDKILENDPVALANNKPFVDTVKQMNVLAKQLYKMREGRGAIDFDIPEVKVYLNDLGDVLNVQKRERNDSHKLIESFMVAANEVIAEHFHRNKLPFVYRIHEKPDAAKMVNFSKFVKTFGLKTNFDVENVQPKDIQSIIYQINDSEVKYIVNRVCLRSLKKAKYYQECLGHFGLASTYYCHFTSPIRRYPDLTIHRIIKHYLRNELNGGLLSNTKHFVSASSQVSSEREVIAEKVERDIDDLYKTFYMTHHLGEEFEGRISSVTAFGVFVELENTVEGLVKLEDLPADKYEFLEEKFTLQGTVHTYKIGDKVKVKAVRADILSKDIDFILA